MINPRKKGHSYELKIISELQRWFPDAVSTRSESKRLDDKGVDICYTGEFHIQCKAVEKLGSQHDILGRMPDDKIRLVVHKRNRKGETVTMWKDDFYRMLERWMK